MEWLGGVPEYWVGSKFKYIFQEKQHTKNMNLPFGAISFGSVVYKEDKANLTEELKENYQEVLQGEFLVNPLNLNYDLKSLRTALSKIDVVVSSGYFVLKLKNNTFNKRYLEYLLYIFDIRKMKTLGAGIRQTLTFKDMAVCDVAIPSACEQTQIASFLDTETTRIDTLIAKQEKLIELLEEQRKSIISHAVTKGLNPNAPMKDSGVEWLGDVPSHWEVKPNKYIFKIQKLIAGKLGYDVLSITQKGLKVKDIESNAGQMAQDYSKYQIVNIGDFAMNHMDLLTGWIDVAKQRGVTSPDYRVFKLKNSNLNKQYFLNIFQMQYKQKILFAFGQGAAQMGRWRLQSEAFNKLKMPYPCIKEQVQIADFINHENLKINKLISKQQALIEKLKEYRASIISHAVTGKIDVREFGT